MNLELHRSRPGDADGSEVTERRSTVLVVAFPYAKLGEHAVGGAEVICSQVERDAVRAGFTTVVVGHAASQPAGILYGTSVPDTTIDATVRLAVESEQQRNIDRACSGHPVALVHMHGLDFDRYRIPSHLPILVTLHLPPAWYAQTIWDLPARYHFVCVSESQKRACPPSAWNRISVIENGVPLPPASAMRSEGRYALLLSRICFEKNLHAGIDAAQRAGLPTILAGETFAYPEHQRYFEQEIVPRLSEKREAGKQVRFVGAVAGAEKQRLLSRAACLLIPSLAEETSSLAGMEALAYGVPVIGMRVGALPEIVEHGRTGFLVTPGEKSVEEMAAAIRRLGEISRSTCHEEAQRRFPLERMLAMYRELHERLSLPADASARSASRQEVRGVAPYASPLRLEQLRSSSELEALCPEWLALWKRDGRALPFQHPAWLLPWWRQFGGDGELGAFAVRNKQNGRLEGLLPSYIYRHLESGRRSLLLVGAGTTDYLEGIWGDAGCHAAGHILQALTQETSLWDEVSFQQLPEGSPLLAAARDAGISIFESESCPVVPTAHGLPAKVRLNAGRYRRRADCVGKVRVTLADSPIQALQSFERLAQLHAERWQARGEEGVLHDPRVLAHHREALPLLLEAGLLRMFSLWLDNDIIGVLYGLASPAHVSERKLFAYLIGFQQSFEALSPGTLLMHAAWQHAQQNGFVGFDLLRGGETYKQLWGAQPEATYAVVSTPRES